MATVTPEVVGQVLHIPRVRIKPLPDQPRDMTNKENPELELPELAASLAEIGQKTAIIVKKVKGDPDFDYQLIDGERRLTAAGMAGLEYMKAEVREVLDDEDHFTSSVVANFGSLGHTPLETARAIQRIRGFKIMKGLSDGEQVKKLAKIFARSEPWVYQHLSLLRLHPEAQKMMGPKVEKEKRLSTALGMFISHFHPDVQLRIAQRVVEEDMNLNQARVFARQVADETGMKAGTAKRRSPADDFNMLLAFMRKVDEGIRNLNTPVIMDQIRRRRPDDLAIAAKQLEDQAREIQRLSRSILVSPRKAEAPALPARPSAPQTRTVSREAAAARVADISHSGNGHVNGRNGKPAEQSLNMSMLVLRTLFYHQDRPQVNLSRSRLMNLVQTEDGPEAAIKQALIHAQAHWRKPLEGNLSNDERKMIRFLQKFRREYGGGAHLADVLNFARNLDKGSKLDPVTLPLSH